MGRLAYTNDGQGLDHEGTSDLSDAYDEWQKANSRLHDAVRDARRNGVTWDQVGGVFGVSRQAAWERFKAAAD